MDTHDSRWSHAPRRQECRDDIARRNPSGPHDGWINEAAFLTDAAGSLGLGAEVGPEHRKACVDAIGVGPAGEAVDVRGWAEALPFADGSLDYVVANHVIEHCQDPVAVLREWRRVLRAGGRIGIVAPDCRHVDTFSLNPEHKHTTTPQVLRLWLQEAGGYRLMREATPVPSWSCGVIAEATEPGVAVAVGEDTERVSRPSQLDPDTRSVARRRVALIYDDSLRLDTTGGYCLRALQAVTDVTHIPPDADRLAGLSGFDLHLCIDDGLEFRFPPGLRPAAFWAIDTHIHFARALQRARGFGIVFAAQKEAVPRLQGEGIAACEWLPLACDPEVHQKLPLEKGWDVAFVGHVFPGPRQQLFEQVRRHFPNSFIGQAPHTEMGRIYSQARIVINCSLANDLNMRVFEALSCGALLITDHLKDNGQDELFGDRVHLVEYRSQLEAIDLISYYLQHDDEREAIAAAGYQEAITKHTYRHRMERVLKHMEVLVAVGPDALRTHAEPPAAAARSRMYYRWARPELMALVPQRARRILDVGCAAGMLGAALKQRQSCEVIGVELNSKAAAEARGRLDQVIEGDIEVCDLSVLGRFDAVICGDVLEHLRSPGPVLAKLRGALSESGVLVASFPNARHMEVVHSLVEGNWTYEPEGLLDRDHLRFFTRRSAEQLLEDAGFDVMDVRGIPGLGYAGWQQAGRPGQIEAGRLAVSRLSQEEAEEFFVGQWLMVARPAPRTEWGLTSIIIVTWNQVPYTQRCIDSIRRHTHVPYELIVVDNGSMDGTIEWLGTQPDVRLIGNGSNLGFPKAANQGLQVAQGENLLLLNNDTVVTPGWLRRLLEHLHAAPEVGLVGPVSNFVSGSQQIAVPYQSLAELDGFAWKLGRAQRGQDSSTDRLVGFCLLMKRELIERIGLLDEQFEVGCYEDDDICLRAIQAGYRLVICEDAFIHHFGGRTFVGSGISFDEIMRKNERRFRTKWGLPSPESTPAPTAQETPAIQPRWRVSQHAEGGLLLVPAHSAISLCMIVRDEEPRIADCLTSIRPFVDEMIVVDTGSQDRTPEIARALGAKVIEATWQESFSAARNLSLEHAAGEWIFWLDADDVIDEKSGQALRQAVENAPDEVLGFVAQVHCPPAPGEAGETVVDHVKLFRNRPGLRFELRIHEQILGSIRRAGGEIARAPVRITHVNYDRSPEGQHKKRARDRRLLELDLQENPEHPFVHFNIGMTACEESDYTRALTHLRRSIELSAPQDSTVRKAYALLASAYRALGQGEEAVRVCQEGRVHYPDDPELLFNEALALHLCGRLQEAERAFVQLLSTEPRADQLGSTDISLRSYKAWHNLGAVYAEMGQVEKARDCWRRVTREHPSFLPSWLALSQSLLNGGDLRGLEALAQQAERGGQRPLALVLRGYGDMQQGDAGSAEARFREAAALAPDLADAHRYLSHVLLQRGERHEVERVLHDLIALCPEDGEAHYNLGCLLLEQQRAREAITPLEEAQRLRPNHSGTQELLRRARAHADAAEVGKGPDGR